MTSGFLQRECPRKGCTGKYKASRKKCGKCGANLNVKNAVWRVVYKNEEGDIRSQTVGPSREAAQHVLEKTRTEVTERRHIDVKKVKRIRIKDYIGDVEQEGSYRAYCKAEMRSYHKLQRPCLNHIVEQWGDIWMDALTNKHLKDIKPKFDDRQTMWNRVLVRLHAMYGNAVEDEVITEIPFTVNDKKYPEVDRLRFLSQDEWQRLRAELAPHLVPVVEIALSTGMRIGEILNLRVGVNVDLEHGMLRLTRTKTDKARNIPVNKVCRAAIEQVAGDLEHNQRLFNQDTIDTGFYGAVDRAGIEDMRIHDLRHTFASWMVQAGVPIYTVSELLGHSAVEVTRKYAHLAPDNALQAVSVLDERITPVSDTDEDENED